MAALVAETDLRSLRDGASDLRVSRQGSRPSEQSIISCSGGSHPSPFTAGAAVYPNTCGCERSLARKIMVPRLACPLSLDEEPCESRERL